MRTRVPERGRNKKEERVYHIGEVAELTGLTHRTLRYYEELGLLGERDHHAGKHRLYSDGDIERLTRIQKFKEIVGHPLCEVKELIDMDEERKTLMGEARATRSKVEKARKLERVREIFVAELAAVNERKKKVEEIVGLLQERIDGIERELESLARPRERGRARAGKSVADG